jgi:hypothetical protein
MMSYEGANAISVAPGLSDLEELIEMLRSYPHVVERVARFQREGVIGGGCLSMAAETSYWRASVRGRSGCAVVDEGDGTGWRGRGMRRAR